MRSIRCMTYCRLRRQPAAGVETIATTFCPPVHRFAYRAQSGGGRLSRPGHAADDGRSAAVLPGFCVLHHSIFWKILAWNQTHTEWSGCSLHDMIQPSFSFLVGVALPYSIRSRQRKGAQFPRMLAHTIWRSLLLIALGIFLRSLYSSQTYFTFEDTLTQIGLGYTVSLFAGLPPNGAISGLRWAPSFLGTGWPGRSIRSRARASTTPRSAFPPIGIIFTPAFAPTGTRTATLARPSMCGS
jgi:hypothetical protein